MANRKRKNMAEPKGRKSGDGGGAAGVGATTGGAPQAGAQRMGIRLVPVGNSDQPVMVNYTALNVAPGMAFIDFGFLEPGMLAAIPRVVKQGGKLPESINGKLAVRVVMSYDVLANLHQQLGQMLSDLNRARAGSA